MNRKFLVLVLLPIVISSCTTKSNRPELNKRHSQTTPSRSSQQPVSQPPAQSVTSTSPSGSSSTTLVQVSNTPQAPGIVEAKVTAPETDVLNQIQQAEKDGQWLSAVLNYEKLATMAVSPQDQALYRIKAQVLVDNKLTPSELEQLSNNSSVGTLRAHALLRLGILAFNNKNFERAEALLKSTQDLLPGSELAYQADTYLSTLKASRVVSPTSIGVVLPLTGRSAVIGQRTLRGIEMGLGIGLPNNSFRLVIADSEGDIDKARAGAEKLIREDNVIALIGDVLSKTSPAVASVAQEFGVPLINLSQRENITDSGEYIFRNALTAEMQIHYLVRTAIQDLGMKRFAVMFPNSSYGVEYSNLFWDYVSAYGGKIVAAQPYAPTEKDFRFPVQRLLSIYYGEARKEELSYNLAELKKLEKNAKKSVRSSTNQNMLKPITDFDAVFVADGLQQLGIISSLFAYYDVNKMYFLGTNIWNNSSLPKRLSTFTDGAIFTDSYQTQFNGTDRYKFVVDYRGLYNEEPGLFEIQGYDTGLLLRQFIVEGAQSRQSLRNRLSSFQRVPGSIGFLSSHNSREIQRPLTAFTVKKGEIIPLKIQK
ncbi:MAG: ABC transporter substrate-binding protein [Bdellovibrionia bacterium]